MKRVQQGFTLIELMIVIAIIGILAAIAIPQYQDYTGRSQMTEAMNLASGLKTAVAEIANQSTIDDADSGSNGIAAAADVTGKYVNDVDVEDGIITATMKSTGVLTALQGATLTLTPTENNGSISWACESDADDKYLPQACRAAAAPAPAPAP